LLRDVGTYQARNLEIRKAVEEGIYTGPRIVACGRLITSIGGHAYELGRQVRGVDEIKAAVREEIAAGADFIKVTNYPIGFSLEELKAIVEEGHRLGKKVACHASDKQSVELALKAGADTIEHAVPFDEDMIERMIEQGTIIVPTYVAALETCKDISKSLITKKQLKEIFQPWLNDEKQYLPRAIESGVKIVTGSDAGYPPLHFDSAIAEIELLVELGASPLQALQAATSVAAEAVGLENSLGALEDGKAADVLIVPRNPLKDITAIEEPYLVIRDGKVIPKYRPRPHCSVEP